jgi:DNA repair photolyase
VGCTHGCPFCYVDSIHRRFGPYRYGEIVLNKWGDYILIPENLDKAIEDTPWEKWRGKEVMLSSTHDPYIPELVGATRKILEKALPAGVRFCIQTRSLNVLKDMRLLMGYRDHVRIQVSIASMSEALASKIEPRVSSPRRRLDILKKAREAGITTGVIVAPVLPELTIRRDIISDIMTIARELSEIGVDRVYGESLHVRGGNLSAVEIALGERLEFEDGFDAKVSLMFNEAMTAAGLNATWWPEKHKARNVSHSVKSRNAEPCLTNADSQYGGNRICQSVTKTIVIGSQTTLGY